MTKNLHAAAGLLGGLTILLFFSSTLAVEASGAHDAIAQAKGLIVWPGLLVLVPLLALTGLTGRKLAGAHPTGAVPLPQPALRGQPQQGGRKFSKHQHCQS